MAYYGILNFYAQSGTSNRAEREAFFNIELMEVLPHVPTGLIMAGDFNWFLSNNDCTEHRSSRASERLIQGLRLLDVRDLSVKMQDYPQSTPTWAARLGRVYMTEEKQRNKQVVESISAAFTYHLAVILRVKLSNLFTYKGRGRWRWNISYLTDLSFQR